MINTNRKGDQSSIEMRFELHEITLQLLLTLKILHFNSNQDVFGKNDARMTLSFF